MSKKNHNPEFTTITETKLIDGEVYSVDRIYNRTGVPISVKVTKTNGRLFRGANNDK